MKQLFLLIICTLFFAGCVDDKTEETVNIAEVEDNTIGDLVKGCLDENATNYNSEAEIDNDSCLYECFLVSYSHCSGEDFSGMNLSGFDLSYADLSGADFTNANLFGTNLSHTNLHGANFFRTNLTNASFNYANLTNANIRYADLFNADLRYANASNA